MSDSSTHLQMVEELLAFVSLARVDIATAGCATSRGWRGAMCNLAPRQRGDLHR